MQNKDGNNRSRVKAMAPTTAADVLGKLQTPFFNRQQQLKPTEQKEVLLQLTAAYTGHEHFYTDAEQLQLCILKIIDTCTTNNINVGNFNHELQLLNSLATRYNYISGIMEG